MSSRPFKLPRLPQVDGKDIANQSITHLPTTILESFIPGYSLISRLLLEAFGFDVSVLVSVFALAFALFTTGRFAYRHAYTIFEAYFTSSISIEAGDDIHDHVMEWLAEQRMTKVSRSLVVRTGQESAWDPEDDKVHGGKLQDEGGLFNFSNWEAKVPPRFEPYFGSHNFFHKGRYFKFRREKEQILGSGGWGSQVFKEHEKITLTVVGRSTKPIKDLITEARDQYLDKEKQHTIIRRPGPKEMRGRGRNMWSKVATRPSRPMETVVLDTEQKAAVLADINEYLHPSTSTWYARRGIPYRRGYLFHGDPGTGKTSLSFAIAGVFGLEIYCISLLEPTLTEEDLGMLFNSLPRRCVVLLEDIDSAGLHRREDDAQDGDATAANTEKGGGRNRAATMTGSREFAKEFARAIKSVNDKNDRNNSDKKQGISLSGLLNAIDGVASHEGRVLIMTTNCPEKLDEALIRPGRVDMKIEFSLATREQIRELFIRMYSSDSTKRARILANGHIAPDDDITKEEPHAHANGVMSNGSANDDITKEEPHAHANGVMSNGSANGIPTKFPSPPMTPKTASFPPSKPIATLAPNSSSSTGLSHSEILQLATEFASKLPESTFSPAEIQGFLLTRKKDPRKAVAEVDDWKNKVQEVKEARKNILSNGVARDSDGDEEVEVVAREAVGEEGE